MPTGAALRVAALAAVVAAAALVVVHVVVLPLGEAAPATFHLPLVALACLCVIGVTVRTRPTVAWLASIAALSVATLDLIGIWRDQSRDLTVTASAWWAIGTCLVASAATTAAVWFAAEPSRRLGRWVPVLGFACVALVIGGSVAVVATAGSAPQDLVIDETSFGPRSVVTRTFLVATTLFVVLGLLGEARPAWDRARRRLATTDAAGRASGPAMGSLLRAFGEEITPGRSRAHRAAVRERSRIARELHAEVVPAVRRAIAEAEQGGSIERLASALREVLDEVDGLVQSQQAIQLEIGGLIPALEWLAERLEERSEARVVIEVVEVAGASGEPPKEVQAAAFRIADLALENVRRHAPGAAVEIVVGASQAGITMSIADDGPGLPTTRARERVAGSGRGLIDMTEEAAACGGRLDIDQPDRGGTVVHFAWGEVDPVLAGPPRTPEPGRAGFRAPTT